MFRRSIRFTFALGFAMALSACFPFDLDIEREFDFEVDLTEETDATISNEELIDLGEEDAFKEAADAIQKVDLKKATLQILLVDETNTATKVSGKVTVSNGSEDAEQTLLAEFTDFAITAGDPVDLPLDEKGLEALRKLVLDAPHKFKVFVEGELDGVPAKFSARLGLHIVITVSVDAGTLAKEL